MSELEYEPLTIPNVKEIPKKCVIGETMSDSGRTIGQPKETDIANEIKSKRTEQTFTSVKDSGQRQQFDTGAVRDSREGKGRFDLIPAYPLQRLAIHYENGARKYSDDNWKKGMSTRRCLDSAMRHLNSVKMGLNDEDHLSAVVFNIFAIIYYRKMIEEGKLSKELDDITD